MARARFGPLSPAELILVRGATERAVVSAGPSKRSDDPGNDPRRADQWGPARTIRAPLLTWLCTDSRCAAYLHPSGPGIMGAKIAGRVDFSYQTVARPLSLFQCALPDGIDLSYAHFNSLDLRQSVVGPLSADISTSTGDIDMQFGYYGPVSLYRATVGGSVDFTGSSFMVGGGVAISAIEAKIAGDAIFHDGFRTDGMVDFRLADIGQALSLSDARFVGSYSNGLDAQRAQIAGPLYWYDIGHTSLTQLDLRDARAASLRDNRASWPAPGMLFIDGFDYHRFSAGSPMEAPERLHWLALQPRGYRPQPYVQLAAALGRQGRIRGEIDVMIAQRVAQRQMGGLGALEWVWNLVLEMTIGYGYLPLRALWWIGGFVVLGAMVFGLGYHWRLITPTEENACQLFLDRGELPLHYPPFNSVVYALDNFLPVVDLHQGLYWRPNPINARRDPKAAPSRLLFGQLLRCYLWCHILGGWILTPLLAAGLSGLIHVA
ncbi:MAG TPA: hypothetical protein VKV28_10360 [Candidatus Binataceae bacterium]|nr:hypothetical protein [Candidatus Binataceae bacterium]